MDEDDLFEDDDDVDTKLDKLDAVIVGLRGRMTDAEGAAMGLERLLMQLLLHVAPPVILIEGERDPMALFSPVIDATKTEIERESRKAQDDREERRWAAASNTVKAFARQLQTAHLAAVDAARKP